MKEAGDGRLEDCQQHQGSCRVVNLGTKQVAFALSRPVQIEILDWRLGLLISQTLQGKQEDHGHTPGIMNVKSSSPFGVAFRRWGKRTSTIIAKINCQCLSSKECYMNILTYMWILTVLMFWWLIRHPPLQMLCSLNGVSRQEETFWSVNYYSQGTV